MSTETGGPRWTWRDFAFLLITPVLAWWALRITLFMQHAYADPWFYTGAGQEFPTLVKQYGWAYYYVRFPIMFVNTLFCQGEEGVFGYVLLRYVIILISGGTLYGMALQQFGRLPARAAFLFLFLNPQYIAVTNWDLTPFLSVPAALTGAALWLWDGRRRGLKTFLAGAMFCVSINCHIFTITAVGCFIGGMSLAHLLWRSPWQRWLLEYGCAAAGFVAMWTAGWLYYRSVFGPAVEYLLAHLRHVGRGEAALAAPFRIDEDGDQLPKHRRHGEGRVPAHRLPCANEIADIRPSFAHDEAEAAIGQRIGKSRRLSRHDTSSVT